MGVTSEGSLPNSLYVEIFLLSRALAGLLGLVLKGVLWTWIDWLWRVGVTVSLVNGITLSYSPSPSK